jgi:transketolase
MMSEALKTADLLTKSGLSVEVVSIHTVKPIDISYLQNAADRFKILVTIEEHGRIGGLGSAIAEWRMGLNRNIAQLSFGTDDIFMHEIGSQSYARKKFGLTPENIAKKTLEAIK